MLKNVEQIEVDICEIYLILVRTCREFNSFNSDLNTNGPFKMPMAPKSEATSGNVGKIHISDGKRLNVGLLNATQVVSFILLLSPCLSTDTLCTIDGAEHRNF